MDESRRRIGNAIRYAKDIYDAVMDADVLLLITEWKEFRMPSWQVVKKLMANPLVLTDETSMIRQKWLNMGSIIIVSDDNEVLRKIHGRRNIKAENGKRSVLGIH